MVNAVSCSWTQLQDFDEGFFWKGKKEKENGIQVCVVAPFSDSMIPALILHFLSIDKEQVLQKKKKERERTDYL